MPEGQILEHESGMGLEASEQATEKQQKELEHDVLTLANEVKKSTFSTPYGVFATHRRVGHLRGNPKKSCGGGKGASFRKRGTPGGVPTIEKTVTFMWR